MKTLIEITGGILIALALLHAIFPRYFRWKEETATLSTITRQVLYVHTFFIALTVFLMGILCVTSANEIINTTLGKKISFGLGIFWGLRLMIQIFGYSSKLWRGKRLETTVHIAFTIFWAWLTALFLINAF